MSSNNITELLNRREVKSSITRRFQRKVQLHPPFVKRLGLERELEGHTGCVNCLEWNERGTLLASGSDDLNAIIWEPLKYRVKCNISTGHTGNIFSIKFLPGTGDGIVATAAADAKVRIHSVETQETTQAYNCHIGRVKRLATAPNTPYILWSAAEDGTIRQFDLRQPHSCNSSSKDCKNILIDLSVQVGAMAEAKCIAVNALQPELLAVGCNDPFVRVYDHRMLSTHNAGEGRRNCSPEEVRLPKGCVQYFAPGHLPPRLGRDFPRRFRAYVVTYVNFSPDGNELLANLGGEQVYLFDIRQCKKVVQYHPINASSSKVTNGLVKGLVHTNTTVKEENGFIPTPNGTTTNGTTNGYKIHTLNGKKPVDQSTAQKVLPTPQSHTASLPLPHRALELKTLGNEAFCRQQFWAAVNCYNEAISIAPNSAVLYANRAAAYIKRSWDGDIYAALRDCHTALTLDPSHNKAHFRQARCLYELRWCQEALSCLQHFKARFPEQAEGNPAKTLERDIKAAAFAETEEPEDEDSSGRSEGTLSGRRRRRLSIMSEQERVLRDSAYDYENRLCGHCNTTTDIKEANFFGSNGQYIVAGSDDGSFFIWSKETANLVRVLKGDDSIVNCLQPHPSMCLLATSGIDPVVRLWSPRAEDGSVNDREIEEVEAAAKANQKRMNADPLEVMLMNMGYRTRFSMAEGSDDEAEEMPVQCRTS